MDRLPRRFFSNAPPLKVFVVPGAEPTPPPEPRPHWDTHTRTLWYGDRAIKRYQRPAPNQEDVWERFEAEGWPPSIPSPFASDAEKHHNTLRSIKETLGPSSPFRLHSDGTGEGIAWERV